MAKKEPVNINWQTIFAIIPWVNLFAAYRVEKFRLFFLIWIGVHTTVRALTYLLGLDESGWFVSEIVGIPLYVALLRYWSKKWNEQFVKLTNSE